MPSDPHQHARLLSDRSLVEGVSLEEQRWLDDHLKTCPACAANAELSSRAVGALGSFAFDYDPASIASVQEAVRAHEMRRNHSWAVALAVLLTITGSMAMWIPLSMLAAHWHWSLRALATVFTVCWILPSMVVDGLLLFRGNWMGGRI